MLFFFFPSLSQTLICLEPQVNKNHKTLLCQNHNVFLDLGSKLTSSACFPPATINLLRFTPRAPQLNWKVHRPGTRRGFIIKPARFQIWFTTLSYSHVIEYRQALQCMLWGVHRAVSVKAKRDHLDLGWPLNECRAVTPTSTHQEQGWSF